MKIIRQPDDWSCAGCVAAMICGKTLEDVRQFVGHDGSHFTEESNHPDKRAGFTYVDVYRFLLEHGFGLGTWLVPGPGGLLMPPWLGDEIKAFPAYLGVKSKRFPDADPKKLCHAVYYIGQELVADPQHDELQPLSSYELIDWTPVIALK